MRRALACLAAATALLLGESLHAGSARTHVLITGFEPFDGRPTNNSWEIAKAVAAARAELGSKVEVSTCLIPVVYDSAARIAEACFDAAAVKPDIVLSLGEAGCQLRMETAAHNLDDTPGYADNAGSIHEKSPIDPSAPEHIGFNLPAPEMYCDLSRDARKDTQVSETPGGFVCNNTAFHLARFFAGKPVQYGFIHVPASTCGEAADVAKTAKPLARMLKRLDRFNARDSERVEATLPHCTNDVRLPTTAGGVEDLLATLANLANDDCRREFLERLKERL